MKCFTCKSRMKCVDDANDIDIRIDWFECPKCSSKSEVRYGDNGEYTKSVYWKK